MRSGPMGAVPSSHVLLALGLRSAVRLAAEMACTSVLLHTWRAAIAVLVGKVFPLCFCTLALVWDYSHMEWAEHFFDLLSVASVAVALHAATRRSFIGMVALVGCIHVVFVMLFIT